MPASTMFVSALSTTKTRVKPGIERSPIQPLFAEPSNCLAVRNNYPREVCVIHAAIMPGNHLTSDIAGAIIFCMDVGRAHCACWVQIPLSYAGPDGRPANPVEEEVISDLLGVFSRQFGGWTPLGESSGSWVNPQDPPEEPIEERSFRIEVAVLPERIEEFKEVVYAIGKRLKQKMMYFNIPEASAYFMDIDDNPAV